MPRPHRYSLKEELFIRALDQVRLSHPGVEVSAGLKGVKLLDWADSTLHLEVPHEFSRTLFEKAVRPLLESALASLTGTDIRLRLHLAQAGPFPERRRIRSFRTRRANLADFLQDDGNRMVYRLVMDYRKARPLFDPLVIHGVSQCGKTHLLRGFLALMKAEVGAGSVKYMTAPVFGRAYRATLYRRRVESFREEMNSPRILVLDEMHGLESLPGAQAEMARLLERRQILGHSTILASRQPPDRIEGLIPALATRLHGGMVVRLHRLRPGTLVAFLKSRLLKRGVRLEPGILERAVHLGEGHPNTTESILLKAVASAREARRPVTLDCVLPLPAPGPDPGPDWKRIVHITSRVGGYFGVTVADLQSPRKVRRALAPRRFLALALRRGFALTSSEIGRYLGGRSLSTVTVMLRQARALLEEDASLRELFAHLLPDLEEERHGGTPD